MQIKASHVGPRFAIRSPFMHHRPSPTPKGTRACIQYPSCPHQSPTSPKTPPNSPVSLQRPLIQLFKLWWPKISHHIPFTTSQTLPMPKGARACMRDPSCCNQSPQKPQNASKITHFPLAPFDTVSQVLVAPNLPSDPFILIVDPPQSPTPGLAYKTPAASISALKSPKTPPKSPISTALTLL